MMKGILMIRGLIFFLGFILTITAHANSISSEIIVTRTLSALPNCLNYIIPTHFCIWMSSQGVVNTTPVLSHYLPDLVVSVFNKPHDNPWLEANKILDAVGQPVQQGIIHGTTGLDAGSGNHGFEDQHGESVIFKEADVIGNPALLMIPGHGLLTSTARSLIPYFQSMTDSMLWRGLPPAALPEEGMALELNLEHHIGTGLSNWGGIYPHEGKVLSDNDVKAAMVLGERAADLLTSSNQLGHVVQRLSIHCGKHCDAATIRENSHEIYFQMIYPIAQNECHMLGDDESYLSDMFNPDGSYVWIIWRHYEGCADGDGQYMGRT